VLYIVTNVYFHNFTARHGAEEAVSKSARAIQGPVAAMEPIRFADRFVFSIHFIRWYCNGGSWRTLTETDVKITPLATIRWYSLQL
jgi:hypothetical protein